MFGSHTRDELRRTYADAWRKQLAGSPLTPLEAMIADVIALHPEYQPVIGDAETALAFEPNAIPLTRRFDHSNCWLCQGPSGGDGRPKCAPQ